MKLKLQPHSLYGTGNAQAMFVLSILTIHYKDLEVFTNIYTHPIKISRTEYDR